MSHSGSVMPSLFSSWSAWIVLQVRQGDALQWERSECQEFANRHISMSLSVYPIMVYFSILSGKLQDMDIVPSSFDAQLPHERKACTELLMAKSYSIALLAHSREQPHVTCILAAALQRHSCIFQSATKRPWFASRPDFWCALHTRPKIQVGPGKLQFREKLYWDVLSTEIANFCVLTLCSQENIIIPFSLQPKGLNSWLSGKREKECRMCYSLKNA